MAGVIVAVDSLTLSSTVYCGVNIKTSVLIAGVFDIVFLDDDIVFLDTGPIVQYRESLEMLMCDGPSILSNTYAVTVDEGETFVLPKMVRARFFTNDPDIYLHGIYSPTVPYKDQVQLDKIIRIINNEAQS